MTSGVVKWFNPKKGYGFINTDGEEADIFVHYKNIVADGFKTLNEGDEVEFELGEGKKGSEAKNVNVTKQAQSGGGRYDMY